MQDFTEEDFHEPLHRGAEDFQKALHGGAEVFRGPLHSGAEGFQKPILPVALVSVDSLFEINEYMQFSMITNIFCSRFLPPSYWKK